MENMFPNECCNTLFKLLNDKMETYHSDTQKRFEKMENQIGELHSKNTNLEKELGEVKAKNANLKTQNTLLQKRIIKLEEEIDSFKKQNNALIDQNDSLKQRILGLEGEVKMLNTQKNQVEEFLSLSNDDNKEFLAKAEKLNIENEKLNSLCHPPTEKTTKIV